MEMEFVADVGTLDPELLQLPDVSSFAVKSNPYIADELFAQWLSLPDTGRLVFFFLFLLSFLFLSLVFIGHVGSLFVLGCLHLLSGFPF